MTLAPVLSVVAQFIGLSNLCFPLVFFTNGKPTVGEACQPCTDAQTGAYAGASACPAGEEHPP